MLKAFEESHQDSYIWMLPYSTLMFVLMILFSALFSHYYINSTEYEMAIVELEKEMTPAKKEIALAKSLQDFIEKMEMEGSAEVVVTAHAIKLKLSSPAMFESGSAELTPFIMPLLVELYIHLRNMENTVVVEGHTDNVPISSYRFGSNWELAAARSFSVIHFFIRRDISPDRLLAHGFSEYRPIFPNTSALGRAMNRRIEITILRGERTT
jgi:chemotaxis protein MotB